MNRSGGRRANVVKAAEQKLHLAFSSGAAMRIVKDIAVSLLGNLSVVQKRLQIELSRPRSSRNSPLVALGAPPRSRVALTSAPSARRNPDRRGKDQPLAALSESRHTLLLSRTPIADRCADRPGRQHLSVLRHPENDPKKQVRARYRHGDLAGL
jgi:hypothetical protein